MGLLFSLCQSWPCLCKMKLADVPVGVLDSGKWTERGWNTACINLKLCQVFNRWKIKFTIIIVSRNKFDNSEHRECSESVDS